jgi:hypothetical protein
MRPLTKRLIGPILALAAVGVAAAFWTSKDSDVEIAGRKAVTDALPDPASATFRHIVTTKSNRTPGVYCVGGEVNGKDKSGAFTGFAPFIVVVGPAQNDKTFVVLGQAVAHNRAGVSSHGQVHDSFECNLPNVPRLQR